MVACDKSRISIAIINIANYSVNTRIGAIFVMNSKNKSAKTQLRWLESGEDFPPVREAKWTRQPLSRFAGCWWTFRYCNTIECLFEWNLSVFSEGQPVLWWSTDPRMVLQVADFKLHHSFKKTLKKFMSDQHGAAKCEIRIDSKFEDVIRTCASKPRAGQGGT